MLVVQRQREAVDLQLRDVFEPPSLSELLAALVKGPQLIDVVAVVEREHRAAVHDLGKPSAGLPPTRWVGLSGVICSGCCCSSRLQLLEQRVVVRVRDLGIVEDIIEVFVTTNLIPQFSIS